MPDTASIQPAKLKVDSLVPLRAIHEIVSEVSATNTTFNFESLTPKLQEEIFHHLDFHSLLKCRVLSQNIKIVVDKMVTSSVLKVDRNFTWNPYFTTRRYFDLNTEQLLGLVRLENMSAVKSFVQAKKVASESTIKPVGKTKSLAPNPKAAGGSLGGKSKVSTAKASLSKTPQARATHNRPDSPMPSGRPSSSTRPPSRNSSSMPVKPLTTIPSKKTKPTSVTKSTTPVPSSTTSSSSSSPTPPPPIVFPLGSVHIRRRLLDYEDATIVRDTNKPPADTTKDIILWTTRLVQNFGSQLTSFTYDDGKRKGSDLSFTQLRSILGNLPNLVFLGITSGNYEHYNFLDNRGERGEVELFPPLAHLKYCWLGYNTTFHLHMDILNAYGGQLKRLTCSRFGMFIETVLFPERYVSTTNSLRRLLDYVKSILILYPDTLSSLEDLKAPHLSSQNLMQEITEMAENPIRWANLKRLSLHYLHHPTGEGSPVKSDFADLFNFLSILSPTLEELCLDFGSCSDFLLWLSEDQSPLTRDVYQPLPRVKKVSLSAISLLRFLHVAKMISMKFPALEKLIFFNWWMYHTEAQAHGFEGECYSGGPRNLKDIQLCMDSFWKTIPTLKTASIRIETWETDTVYKVTRHQESLKTL